MHINNSTNRKLQRGEICPKYNTEDHVLKCRLQGSADVLVRSWEWEEAGILSAEKSLCQIYGMVEWGDGGEISESSFFNYFFQDPTVTLPVLGRHSWEEAKSWFVCFFP